MDPRRKAMLRIKAKTENRLKRADRVRAAAARVAELKQKLASLPGDKIEERRAVEADLRRAEARMAERSVSFKTRFGEVRVPAGSKSGETKNEQAELTKVHRGGGKWFVMAGGEKVSGPHKKDEIDAALDLAKKSQ